MREKTLQVIAKDPQQRLQVMRRKPAGLSGFDPLDIALPKVPAKALGDLALRESALIA
jgi:hypothetical protein